MKRNGKKSKKIRKLIIASTLSAIVLIVSTYTWFIGMQTVNVSPFEIDIASTEGLFLSLDGENWFYQLDDISTMHAYDGNTNNFENQDVENGIANGLIPMSSVGDLDPSVSRMKLYDKGSLTTSPGGYRLLSGRVNNYEDRDSDGNIDQGDGYIVFDLFVKNLSGNEYYTANEPLNEEAIYLTTDSAVKVFTTGSDNQDKTGIENSVRVGFTQLGRVKATTESVETITKMTCNISTAEGATNGKPVYTESTGVTGICRNAQIWEPNDTKHVGNAVRFYQKSCAKRVSTGDDVTSNASYDLTKYSLEDQTTNKVTETGCKDILIKEGTNYEYVPTYAISRVLGIEDNVDIYDGEKYNQYTKNTVKYSEYSLATGEAQANYKLVEFPYFTDTDKNKSGNTRPAFMTLAPNSITKLRVYIWIEGQDIDNYDFAIMGRKISVNFGFTKERFDGDGSTDNNDVNYDGPAIPATADNSALPATGEAQS